MSKANRKERKKADNKAKENKASLQLPPLSQNETLYFNELVEASNSYSELLTQKTQFEFVVKQLQENRKKVQKDEIKMPISIVLVPKIMTYQESDKKKVLEMMDKHITNFTKSLSAIQNQIEYRYEGFVESGIRNKEYFLRRFGGVKAKFIVPERNTIEDETTLFEEEIDALLKDPKKKEEFEKAKKEAVKLNKVSKGD